MRVRIVAPSYTASPPRRSLFRPSDPSRPSLPQASRSRRPVSCMQPNLSSESPASSPQQHRLPLYPPPRTRPVLPREPVHARQRFHHPADAISSG